MPPSENSGGSIAPNAAGADSGPAPGGDTDGAAECDRVPGRRPRGDGCADRRARDRGDGEPVVSRTLVVRRVHGYPREESIPLDQAARLFEEKASVVRILEGRHAVYSFRELAWLAEQEELRDKTVLEIAVLRFMSGG